MKANQKFSFIRLGGQFKWNVLAVDGRKNVRCAGSGSVKDWEKKNAKEKQEELELNNYWIYFSIPIMFIYFILVLLEWFVDPWENQQSMT